MKSLRRKDGTDEPPGPGRNGERNFRGEKRGNETHASTTDPDARLARKSQGQEAKLGFTGHLLMENGNGLLVDARLSQATGTAEPRAALEMLGALPVSGKKTMGADKNYDTAAFVAAARKLNVTPHVAQNITTHRGSNIDGRTTRHAATEPARSSANASRRPTVGSRKSPGWRRPSIAVWTGSAGCLPSRRLHTT